VSELIDRLLSAMTLEEKLGQLNMIDAGPADRAELDAQIKAGLVGSLLNTYGDLDIDAFQKIAMEESRLRIPLIFGYDVLHGHRTIFPLPIAEAGAFDPDLWERTARVAVEEAGRDGLTITFAPMLDISRDPRWGRIAESPGEDPLVASRYAEAKVRGFQGTDLSARESMAATAKHYVAYGAATAGRDYGSADISERQLHEVYLPPFEAAVKAGVAAIMPSFNDLYGEPMTAHGHLMNDVARGQWGFDGVFVSDYTAVFELIAHGIAGDVAEAAALALNAGLDIDMQDQAFIKGLPEALERGLVTMPTIDRAVRRVLALKVRLGLFDHPRRRLAAPPLTPEQTAKFTALGREAAAKSTVLLKNDNNVLPLKPDVKRIALIGPLGDDPLQMFGCWFAAAGMESATIHQGLRAALPQAEIRQVNGVHIYEPGEAGIAEAVAAARDADVVLLAVGETKEMTGEAQGRGQLGLPGSQRALAEAVLALGKRTVAILCAGRPLTVPWLFERVDAALATWFLGSEAGHGIADVLTGAWNPSARLSVSWPHDVGQIPIFHAHRPTGRPGNDEVYFSNRHTDLPIEPQFHFGHGLSYTKFEVTNLRVTPAEVSGRQPVTVEAEVANTGSVAGEHTLFLFLRDPVASVARPVLELKRFTKVTLKPGERSTVRFTLAHDDLGFLDREFKPRVEPGEFQVFVGPSADRSKLAAATLRVR
jgi:beta-glucosidase